MSSKIDDARKEVIDFITKKLENENSVPWRDPCFNRAPINPISGTEYKGFNSMKLACVAMKRNYNDPRWVTFKQAKEKKYHLKKGSKGTTVEYYQYCKGELSDLEKEELKNREKQIKKLKKCNIRDISLPDPMLSSMLPNFQISRNYQITLIMKAWYESIKS